MLRSSDAPLRNSDLIHLRFGLGSGIFRSSPSGPNVCCGDHLLLSGLEILGDGSRGPGISPVPVQRESKGSPCVEVEEVTCRPCGICSCGRTACWGIEKGYVCNTSLLAQIVSTAHSALRLSLRSWLKGSPVCLRGEGMAQWAFASAIRPWRAPPAPTPPGRRQAAALGFCSFL